MKTLNNFIVNTKLFKKISICFCSLLMVFASVFCPYSEVKALVGVDDAFYAYAFVTALGVLGIGLASSDASRDVVVDVGTKAYNSFKKYVPMIGEAAVTNVTNFFNFCKDTGKIALDKLDGIKGDIEKWWNSTITASTTLSTALSGMGITSLCGSYLNDFTGHMPSSLDRRYTYGNHYIFPEQGLYLPDYRCITVVQNSNIVNGYPTIFYKEGNYYFSYIYTRERKTPDYYYSSQIKGLNFMGFKLFFEDGNETSFTRDDYFKIADINTFSFLFSNLVLMNMENGFYAYCISGDWTISNYGTLELDPPKKVTDSFKLDDRVLGLDNVLKLTDTIVGAVGSLTLDKTKNVTTTLGTLDIPDTATDFPYTGTWDNTLGKIGAIAWNPDIDVPIADTKIIAPTITPDGKPNTDKKVDDFDGEGGQLIFDWKNVFPFCIPFDLITFIKCLCADPEAPKLDIPFNVPIVNYKGSIKIDLSKYDDIAKLCRTLFDLLFILGLAYGTRELIKG